MVRGLKLDGKKVFLTRPDRSWGPPGLLYNGYRISFAGGEAAGICVDQPQSSVEVKDRIQLHLHSSWSALGWKLLYLLLFFSPRNLLWHHTLFPCILYFSPISNFLPFNLNFRLCCSSLTYSITYSLLFFLLFNPALHSFILAIPLSWTFSYFCSVFLPSCIFPLLLFLYLLPKTILIMG